MEIILITNNRILDEVDLVEGSWLHNKAFADI